MQEITVKIKWNKPDEAFWLNHDNVSLALHAYCKNTKFEVSAVQQAGEADSAISSCPMCGSTDPEHFHVKKTWRNPPNSLP